MSLETLLTLRAWCLRVHYLTRVDLSDRMRIHPARSETNLAEKRFQAATDLKAHDARGRKHTLLAGQGLGIPIRVVKGASTPSQEHPLRSDKTVKVYFAGGGWQACEKRIVRAASRSLAGI